MDKLTGNQSHLTGADDFSLQSNLPDFPQANAEAGSSETLESKIIAQSLDFKAWIAQVQTSPASRSRMTARQTSLLQQPAKHSAPWAKFSKQIRSAVSGQLMIEISEVDITTGDGKTFWGWYLDNPREGDHIYGSVTPLNGWVISRQAKAIAVHVTFKGESIAKTPVAVDRPDVKKAYSFLPDAQRSGFNLELDLQSLPSEGKLEVKVVLADQMIQTISSFKFTKYKGLF